MINVLFVCLGNICRSPTAHGVFESKVQAAGLSEQIKVDSCGTGAWHVGHAPDERSQQIALQQGYDLSHLRARKIQSEDFSNFDVILTMDTRNMADVLKIVPEHYQGRLQLLLDYAADDALNEVPDPYYGDGDGFLRVLELVEIACSGLLDTLCAELSAPAADEMA